MSIRTTIATLVSLLLMAVAASADSIPSNSAWAELVSALRQARPPIEASPANARWLERDLDRRLRRIVDLLLTYPTHEESARESQRERGDNDDDSRNRERRRRRHQTPRASAPQAVPEPGGLILVTVGAVVACAVVRRRAERRHIPR